MTFKEVCEMIYIYIFSLAYFGFTLYGKRGLATLILLSGIFIMIIRRKKAKSI